MSAKRISQRRLTEIADRTGDRDNAILLSLETCRYLTSGQIQRLHFTDHANHAAALRATNRGLTKLQGYGLIESLVRRVGGIRAGSGSYVWALVEAGTRLLDIKNNNGKPRKRFFEPSSAFMEHTLAVSEVYVQVIELCGRHQMAVAALEIEPACWRTYVGEDGKTSTLKPDLYTVTVNGEYEDSYFIERDMNSESRCIILEKCRRYVYYYHTGTEQKKSGVFPLVVWIVSNSARKEKLQRYIAESRELQLKNIFIVITPEQFETLLLHGAEGLRL